MDVRHKDLEPSAMLGPANRRDVFGTVALVAAAISLVGFAVLVIGHLADPADFNNGKQSSAANNISFLAYVLGLLVALGLGGAVWFYGHRTRQTGPRSFAAIATYYGAAALVTAVVALALGA
jgi:hypothetical protein